jgi:colanic acid biosynthesis glycosyl transferase WcaI
MPLRKRLPAKVRSKPGSGPPHFGGIVQILLINQFFWPDLAATSQLLTDLVSHMAKQGHDVTVICAKHSYAGDDCTEQPPVKIVRVPDLAFARGRVARPLSYVSFLLLAAWAACRLPKQDIVITMTTPPLLGMVGFLVQRLRGVKHYIWEMDLYPDAAVGLQVLSAGSPITRLMAFIADYVRRRAAAIIVLGECMRARVISHGIDPDRVVIAENWADGTLLRPSVRKPGREMTLIYPGNLGLAHDTATFATAMRELKSNTAIQYLFVGGGARLAEIRRSCEAEGVSTAVFLPYCSRDRLNELLSTADIGLVTQTDASLGSVVPSKAYALMAAGLPILFIGPEESTVAAMIRRFQCGWELRCGDSSGLVRLLGQLQSSRELVAEAGIRARQAFLERYDKPVGVQRVCDVLGLTHAV